MMELTRHVAGFRRTFFMELDTSRALLIVILNTFLTIVTKAEMTITCSCTTSECALAGRAECSTLHMCFTQHLDLGDGGDAVVRGCIDTRTSLLCENMPPATRGRHWPVLLCCRQDLCNLESAPTVPPWYNRNGTVGALAVSGGVNTASGDGLPVEKRNNHTTSGSRGAAETATEAGSTGGSSSSSSSITTAVSLSVAIAGVAALAVLCATAARVLRRRHRSPSYARHRPYAYEKGESDPAGIAVVQLPCSVMADVPPPPAYYSRPPSPNMATYCEEHAADERTAT